MLKKIIWLSLFVVVALMLLTGAIYYKVSQINNLVLTNEQPIEYEVASGSSLYSVKSDLSSYATINELIFRIWVKLNPEFNRIQAGLYVFEPKSKFIDTLTKIKEGKVKQFSVTLIEGLYFEQWVKVLSETEYLVFDIKTEQDVYQQLVKSTDNFCTNNYQKLEGCLLPDTYFFTKGTKASEIIERALAAMRNELDAMWNLRFKDIPIQTKYQALILASIIEKETAIESERSEIAGVFTNRLESNMRLQTDPTVIYGIKDSFDGNLTRAHLKQATPYNTYVINGLPITPIAMPNKASIQAALQPALTDSLYFVATGDGSHRFSSNLEDHNKAVRAYLNTLKNRKE